MPPAGFETAIPGSKRQETLALDSAATGIGKALHTFYKNNLLKPSGNFAYDQV
jgi:hypothetical protein